MSHAYFAVLWEADYRAALKTGRWIGCERDWRPAAYSGCRCESCTLVRAIAPDRKEFV